MKKFVLRARWGYLTGIGIIILCMGVMFGVVNRSPSTAAQTADILRDIFGDIAVARLETFVFQVQDQFQKWGYELGLKKVAPPWAVAIQIPISETQTPSEIDSPSPTLSTFTPTPATIFPLVHLPTSRAETISHTVPVPSPTTIPSSTPSPTPTEWRPMNLSPMGFLKGEGIWSEYIRDASGRVISYRTFLQPDPSRLYAVVGVVAFDMSHTRLHFILGSVEPYSKNGPKRTGLMPAADRVPSVLMAMFNGGFKARHGLFGAMSDGVVALPPKDGLGTIAIYKDGRVRMGVRREEIKPSADLQA
jgi:hypothetical protein